MATSIQHLTFSREGWLSFAHLRNIQTLSQMLLVMHFQAQVWKTGAILIGMCSDLKSVPADWICR